MKVTKAVIQRLEKIQKESGLSQRQFSLAISYSASTLHQIYNSYVKVISKPVIGLLELKFGVNPEWLETGKGPENTGMICTNDRKEVDHLQGFRRLSPAGKRINATMLEALLLKEETEKVKTKKKEKSQVAALAAGYRR